MATVDKCTTAEFLYELFFSRYFKWATTEDDGWYGNGLLPGSVDDSEANQHYAQFFEVIEINTQIYFFTSF
jgi:hypothetical protein